MTMSKKDYEALAAAIEAAHKGLTDEHRAAAACVVNNLRPYLEENPKFDLEKFAKACGLVMVIKIYPAVFDERFALSA